MNTGNLKLAKKTKWSTNRSFFARKFHAERIKWALQISFWCMLDDTIIASNIERHKNCYGSIALMVFIWNCCCNGSFCISQEMRPTAVIKMEKLWNYRAKDVDDDNDDDDDMCDVFAIRCSSCNNGTFVRRLTANWQHFHGWAADGLKLVKKFTEFY